MSKMTLKTEGETHIIVTRRFSAPPETVYRAHTDPKLIQKWLLGPEGWSMPVCVNEARPGGKFRYECIEAWHGIKRTLLGIANLSWISVVLLAATLTLTTAQLSQASGGNLPQYGPKSLPQGVLALDGWANRLIVLSFRLWVFVAAWHAIQLRREHA